MFKVARSFLIVALAAVSLQAATFVVPPDETLIDDSKTIVSGVVVAAEPRFNDAGEIETVITIQVDEVLKGAVTPSRVSLVEWGGRIGEEAMVASGAPRYEVGKSYLIFLTADRVGQWTTQHLTLGRFEKKGDLFVRDVAEVHGWDIYGKTAVEIDRRAEPFREFIRQRVAGIRPAVTYFVEERPDTVGSDAEIAPNFAEYDFEDACDIGAASWTNDSGSDVQYTIGADTSDTALDLDTGADKIIEEDPHELIPGAFTGSGTVAQARWRSVNGSPLDTITGSNVITQNGIKASSIGQSKFRTAMAHELGHTLGFRHSNEECTTAVPCTTDAVMNSSVGAFNGALRQWDINAVRAVYGSAGGASDYVSGRRTDTAIAFKLAKEVCLPVSITTHPAALTNLTLGATVQLSVIAAGSTPLTYQWYSGVSPDTSTPIGAPSTSNKLNVTPQAAGTFNMWVKVSNTCDDGSSANSNTAVVTATCANPAITANPQNANITQGNSTQLQVTATGTGLSYQWYRGESGVIDSPVGGNSNKVTVSPSETAKYWVRVSGQCGHPVDSAAATVTVSTCASITLGQPTSTPGLPTKFMLSITGSSTATPVTYEWFKGTTPGAGGEKVASTQSVTVTATTATSFWARVKNGCNRTVVSSLITVGGTCTLPTISTQPADATINSGQTANLSIVFANGTSVKWYSGVVGDRSNEIGAAANITVGPLTATSQFWAEVSGVCGAVASRQVTVTVAGKQCNLAELVPLLGGRFFVQVAYKNQFDNGKEGKLLGCSLFSTALSETAVFTFGDPKVVELLVRVSDARPFENRIHIFLGGLSDVEFSVVVTDSLTGIVHQYDKPANQLIGVIDRNTFPASNDGLRGAFDSLKVAPNAESSTIRLLNNRFEVRMRYRNPFTTPAGEGYMNARSIASSPTTETAVFFFDENIGSAEWMVRFSDARPFENRIDLFHGGLSDVEFTVEVLDTQTGQRKEYHKPPFVLLGQVDRDTYLP